MAFTDTGSTEALCCSLRSVVMIAQAPERGQKGSQDWHSWQHARKCMVLNPGQQRMAPLQVILMEISCHD